MNLNIPQKKHWFNAQVIAWALFDVGATMFSMNIISRYYSLWVVKEMGGSVLAFNMNWSASVVIAGIFQLFLSPISDELGRRRIFIVGFTLICIIACGLIHLSRTLATGLFLFAIANIGYQTASVFYNAMLGDVSDERHRARISGIGTGLGYLGAIAGLLISARFADTRNHIYLPVFRVTAGLFLIFALPLFLFVKEKPSLIRFNLAESLQNSVGSFIITLRRVIRQPEILFFFIGCLLALDAVHTVIVNMALYCENVVGLDPSRGLNFPLNWKDRILFHFNVSEIDLFLISSIAFAVFGSFIIGHFADKIGHYRALLGVLSLWMAALILAMFSVQRKLFWFTGPLFGLGFGGIWTVSRAYLLDICHPEERGQMFAIYGLVGKGAAAVIGPLIWGGTFTLSRFIFDERKSYRMAIGAMLVLMVLGFWVILHAKPKAQNGSR